MQPIILYLFIIYINYLYVAVYWFLNRNQAGLLLWCRLMWMILTQCQCQFTRILPMVPKVLWMQRQMTKNHFSAGVSLSGCSGSSANSIIPKRSAPGEWLWSMPPDGGEASVMLLDQDPVLLRHGDFSVIVLDIPDTLLVHWQNRVNRFACFLWLTSKKQQKGSSLIV